MGNQQCCVEEPAVDKVDGAVEQEPPIEVTVQTTATTKTISTNPGVVEDVPPAEAPKDPEDVAPAEAPKAPEDVAPAEVSKAPDDVAPAEAPKALEAPEQETDEQPSVVQFFVNVEKTAGVKIGLTFDALDEPSVLIVTRIVAEGLVDAWNKANPDKAVQVDDALIGLNGASAQLSQKLGVNQGQLELKLRRPKSLMLSLSKENQLGASLSAGLSPGSEGVFVRGIREGGMFAQSTADFGIKPGDRIVSVNGKRDDAFAMLKSLQEAQSLELQVMSY